MRNQSSHLLLSAITLLAVIPSATLMAQTPAGVETYQIDSVHSNIGFRVRHLMSKVTGRFGKVDGTVRLNTRDISRSSVDVTIQVASVTTNDDKRDGHLKSPDFFDAAKFPTITFRSTSVKEVAKGRLEVTGSFTMKGVTKTLVLPMATLGTAVDPWKNVIAGFEGQLKLNRQDYGVSYGPGLVGDDVDIDLNVEAKKAN
ncbi:MAG: YceI family protein [Holophaga sp.]|nr:YceI family protein [Holophaga sp.]